MKGGSQQLLITFEKICSFCGTQQPDTDVDFCLGCIEFIRNKIFEGLTAFGIPKKYVRDILG